MTTIAEELLNDFDDSGSEEEQEQNEDSLGFGDSGNLFTSTDGATNDHTEYGGGGGMELDDDEEEVDEADIEGGASRHTKMEEAEDEEETKARVEKMELKTVSDVRSVAGLMKQLDPVIEVSRAPTEEHHRLSSFTST